MDARDEWFAALRDAIKSDTLVKVTLSAPRGGEEARNLFARPVQLRAGPRLSLVWRYPTRDRTQNLPHDEALAQLRALLGERFGAAHLHTTEATLAAQDSGGRFRLSRGPAAHTAPPKQGHDREPRRVVKPEVAWMSAVGLCDDRGRTVPGQQDKRRQVDRFIEVLHHLLGSIPRPEHGRLRLVDMGCGKGYLTFAAYDYLRQTGFGSSEVLGIELRPELAAKVEDVARRLGYDGLSFMAGSIADAPLEGAEVIVALHACDTATDDALAAGVSAGARWLVAAPCCHREVRPQLRAPAGLEPAWQHGILLKREAEIATDALRAALLEAAGYEAKVFEFVSAEHTDKNLMITAVRRDSPRPDAVERARALARFYGIAHQRLAERLYVSLADR